MRVLLLSFLIVALLASGADAQVKVLRVADENPVKAIAKATFWGGVAGLLLGGAAALVVDEDDRWDTVKWFFVGGVFVGCGFGVVYVLTRPSPTGALLEMDGNGLALGMPTIQVRPQSGFADPGLQANVTLFSASF